MPLYGAGELPESFVDRDEAEVQHVDAIGEVHKPELSPGPLKRDDCLIPGVVVITAWRGPGRLVEGCWVADCRARHWIAS